MSFAYLPFYTGDYFRDTRGLSMAGHGCYFLLLTYCWDCQGPLPLDEERIAGICEARNQEERTTLAKVLHSYFVRMEDGWYQPRMQREIERSNAISDKRRHAGREGATERMRLFRERNLANGQQVQANAKQVTLTPSPSPSLSPTPEKVKCNVGLTPDVPPLNDQKTLKGKALRDAAKRVIDQLNKLAGRKYDYVDANLKPILARFAEGYTERDLCAIAAVKARQWKGDEKMDAYLRPKTLFNATNAANYRAELPTNKIEAPDA